MGNINFKVTDSNRSFLEAVKKEYKNKDKFYSLSRIINNMINEFRIYHSRK